MSKSLIALKPFTYAGRALQAGDPFTASSAEARALCAIRRAAPADTYQTAEAKPEVTKETPEVKKSSGKVASKKASTKE